MQELLLKEGTSKRECAGKVKVLGVREEKLHEFGKKEDKENKVFV